jgi:putative inorganic carbon (HCO3(-)) transporter
MTTTPVTPLFRADGWHGWIALVFGLGATAMAAAFVSIQWSLFIVGALIVFLLSMAEWEPFFLLIILILPVSWRLQADQPVKDVQACIHLLVALGYYFGRLLRGQFSFHDFWRHPLSRGSLFFLGAAYFSSVLGSGGWTHLSARAIFFFTSYVAFYFFMVNWIRSSERMTRVVLCLITSLIFIGAFAIYQQISGGYSALWYLLNPPDENPFVAIDRTPSFFNYSNTLGGYLGLTLPLALACFISGDRRWRALAGWSLGFGLVALTLSQSRGAIVAFWCVLAFAIVFFVQSWRKRLVLFCGSGMLAVGFYLAARVWNPGHFGDLDTLSAASRLFLWDVALQMFVGSPIFGVGIGNFLGLYGAYLQNISWIPPMLLGTHNIYIQMLSETGIVGFFSFFLLVYLAIREATRQLRSKSSSLVTQVLGFGVLGAILATLTHGFVDYLLDFSGVGTVFWALLGMLAANAYLRPKSVPSAGVSNSPLPPVGELSLKTGA